MSISCEPASACPGCGRTFICGMKAGLPRCWCAELPPLEPLPDAGKGCYCQDCLKRMLDAQPLKLA